MNRKYFKLIDDDGSNYNVIYTTDEEPDVYYFERTIPMFTDKQMAKMFVKALMAEESE